jgi:serine/threonine-protein kinase
LLGVMPRKERKRLADVLASANELHSRIASLSLAQPGRSSAGTGGAEALMLISSEIRTLEDNADPFDSERAEQRVRRLAFLRRQHRQLHEEQDVAALQARKLEECCIALHNIRLDLSRLRGGTASLENLTTLAQRAISLAGEVDGAIARTGSVDLSGPGEPRPVPKPGQ